jgi:hypothetical protein
MRHSQPYRRTAALYAKLEFAARRIQAADAAGDTTAIAELVKLFGVIVDELDADARGQPA